MDDPSARGAEPAAHPKRPEALRARVNVRTAFERLSLNDDSHKECFMLHKQYFVCTLQSANQTKEFFTSFVFFVILYNVYSLKYFYVK